ncbi:AABR07067459.1 [Phodopus roborovskii]|uniref:AABR07067459.1 protein n=1 Tax=Phodopus roborovskii TaxID=109678 RepID=A0AAU9YPS9_PHORO|nr:AABR07067459.1 [Phodopus roborovskii]
MNLHMDLAYQRMPGTHTMMINKHCDLPAPGNAASGCFNHNPRELKPAPPFPYKGSHTHI